MDASKKTFIEGLRDERYAQIRSALPIEENLKQTLEFFTKSGNHFTNIDQPNRLGKEKRFWAKALSAHLYNRDGSLINWAHAGVAGLVKFLRESKVVLKIEDSEILDITLDDFPLIPDVAALASVGTPSDQIGSIAVAPPRSVAQLLFLLPEEVEVPKEGSVYLNIEGTSGAYSAPAGFTAQTRLLMKLHGVLDKAVTR